MYSDNLMKASPYRTASSRMPSVKRLHTTQLGLAHHHKSRDKLNRTIDSGGISTSDTEWTETLCLATKMDYKLLSKLSSLAGGIVCEEVGVRRLPTWGNYFMP